MSSGLKEFGLTVVILSLTPWAGAGGPSASHQESADVATAGYPPWTDPTATSPATQVQVGSYTSIQVNVDASGQNIEDDAANEPSLVVSATDPDVLVIGWRQFDSFFSSFRQAGWAYSHDRGETWESPGVLEPGIWGSDPVLDSDSDGNLYFLDLTYDYALQVFRSMDDGQSWRPPVPAFAGDKPWMVIDRSGGIGDGNIYVNWQYAFGCCELRTFTRSTDGGTSFEEPIELPLVPSVGTMAVGPDGELYVSGIDGSNGLDWHTFVVAKSVSAQDPAAVPTFTAVEVDLGGYMRYNSQPNPAGFAGQANVAVDHSDGPSRGNVYLLASAYPWHIGGLANPLDVQFARSTDGGATWSEPVRINDDAYGEYKFHWFAAMSVAPDGRIDVVWNDTRESNDPEWSRLYYSYSVNQGENWSPNIPVTPEFDSHRGWPNQNKIGDYLTIVSDELGAHVAYAATFNEEQDVYYLRLFPDCNENGVSDVIDLQTISLDCNDSGIPDECEGDCNGNGLADECDIADGTSIDCDLDGFPDECETDCNANEQADDCDIAQGISEDCNANGLPDACDINLGGSGDCNANTIPDECDISDGSSDDCNVDGIPDECQPDCNGNSSPDDCDLAEGIGDDCNMNGVPDECDIASGSGDCNLDGVLDECDPDCNINALSDVCEVVLGIDPDCNGNSIPDRCDLPIEFPATVITTEAIDARAVVAADLNGDGTADVVSASSGDNSIAWHANLDGLGTFGPRQIVTTETYFATSVAVADLDGDEDPDLLSASFGDGKIAWYENLDGAGTFGNQRLISTFATGVWSVFAADIDDDQDVDVVAASTLDGEIIWHENVSGTGSFGGAQTIATEIGEPRSVFVVDLDGDGDGDVLATSQTHDQVMWYENFDGGGEVWTRHDVAIIDGARPVFSADLDGDLDHDILAASFDGGEIFWYENLDGSGSFHAGRLITDQVFRAVSLFVSDLDLDGDPDVLCAAEGDNKISWYENVNALFGPQQIVSLDAVLPQAVFAEDIDGDERPDVLSASLGDEKIAWYRAENSDCNANLVPDECEPDCNLNGIPDDCDVNGGTHVDCNGNGLPDECDTACGPECDADGDGCLDDLDDEPLDGDACADTEGDGCDDCSSGVFDPLADGVDTDADGFCDPGDCDALDETVWSEPSAIGTLSLSGTAPTALSWSPPVRPGAVAATYDMLRSNVASDHDHAAECLSFDQLETGAQDPETPAGGNAFYYLIRVENDCPDGEGNLGRDSEGSPRTGRLCP